jgi:hypothetical protein
MSAVGRGGIDCHPTRRARNLSPEGSLIRFQWRALPVSNKLQIKISPWSLTVSADGLWAIGAAVFLVLVLVLWWWLR